MRIIFMGTPDFAVPALRALHAAGHEIACVYTQPPRPAGRGKKLMPSPVQVAAEAQGVPVRSPVSLRNAEAQAEFAALGADVAVVAAYGLILPQAVLDAPAHGCLNIHASLLPRWRGAAPIHRAVMAGDAETGVTIMQMEAGLDTGPMLHKVAVPIGRKTTGELFAELGAVGAAAMVEVLANLAAFTPEVQDDTAAIYAPKIDKAVAKIDWSESAAVIERTVRGLAPFPGAWFEIGDERVKLLLADAMDGAGTGSDAPGTVLDDGFTIACGQGAIRPLRLQRAGKPVLECGEFLRGRPVAKGHDADVTRYALTLEFDGTPFHGLQRQSNGPSVQQAVEDALHRITGETVALHSAGRTDAGVHALAMRSHVDIAKPFDPFRLMGAINAHLRPDPIAVTGCEVVSDDWHARFSCTGRRYMYRIVNRRAPLALQRDRAWQVATPLDAATMHRAAQVLVGRHDFTTFRSVHCQAGDPVKTLDLLEVERVGDEVHIHAAARSFLHHQVRSMVGCLKLVGTGTWDQARLAAALAARDRAALGLNAPPQGLYFVEANYPGDERKGAV